MVQDLIVTLVTLGATVILGRRVWEFVGPAPKGGSACGACAASKGTTGSKTTDAPAVIPLGSLRSARPSGQ
jgi:hypothetical protein